MVSPKPASPTPIVGTHSNIADSRALIDRDSTYHQPLRAIDETSLESMADTDWDAFDALIEVAVNASESQPNRRRQSLLMPAVTGFVIYYFALLLLMSYAHPFMSKMIGPVSLGYLFALSQFFLAWVLAVIYVRASGIFNFGLGPKPKKQ